MQNKRTYHLNAEALEIEEEEAVADVKTEAVAEIAEEEEPASFEELFTLQPEVFEMVENLDGAETDEDEDKVGKKKKKKKKKYVEMEYDPDADFLVVKKKRKRSGESEWDEDWEV